MPLVLCSSNKKLMQILHCTHARRLAQHFVQPNTALLIVNRTTDNPSRQLATGEGHQTHTLPLVSISLLKSYQSVGSRSRNRDAVAESRPVRKDAISLTLRPGVRVAI